MSYERHGGLGFAPLSLTPVAQDVPASEPSIPLLRVPFTMTAKASAAVAPSTRITVPLNERAAYIRWYSNILGPGKSVTAGPGGVVTTTRVVYERFKAARARIARLATGGVMRVLTPLRGRLYALWHAADEDGLAAFDRVVTSRAADRDTRSRTLDYGPRNLVVWFNQQVNAESTQLGLTLEAAAANVVRRGVPESERVRLLGFAPQTIIPPVMAFNPLPSTVPGVQDEQQAVDDAVTEAIDAATDVEQEQELPPPDDMPMEPDADDVQQAGMFPFQLPWWGWAGIVTGVVGLSVFGYWYTKKRRPEALEEWSG